MWNIYLAVSCRTSRAESHSTREKLRHAVVFVSCGAHLCTVLQQGHPCLAERSLRAKGAQNRAGISSRIAQLLYLMHSQGIFLLLFYLLSLSALVTALCSQSDTSVGGCCVLGWRLKCFCLWWRGNSGLQNHTLFIFCMTRREICKEHDKVAKLYTCLFFFFLNVGGGCVVCLFVLPVCLFMIMNSGLRKKGKKWK